MLITADHGNAEMMIDPVTGGPHTAHTTYLVPFILLFVSKRHNTYESRSCWLRQISPTMLGDARR